MDLLVAVVAAPVGDLPCSGRRIVWARWVSGLNMTLLTEPGNPDLQESRICGAVRLVAVRTALCDWRMFPEERPPLLRMALVTVVIDRIFPEHRLGGGPMRVVAVATTDLPLAQRHMRTALELGPAGLVTLRADLDRGRLRQVVSGGHRLHHLVTGHAGHATHLVGAPLPGSVLTLFMAAVHARGILCLDRLCPLLERHQCFNGIALRSYVRAPRAMTRLTDPLLLGGARVYGHDPPHHRLVKALARLLMARQAGLTPHILGAGRWTGPLRSRGNGGRGGWGLRGESFFSGGRRAKSTARPSNKENNK